MHLLTAWRDSLAIFKPKSLKLFLLVTLNAMVQGAKVWIKYFWWLPIISLVSARFTDFGDSILLTHMGSYLYALSFFLVLRPSVRRKTGSYFLSYLPHALLLFFFCVVYLFLFDILCMGLFFWVPDNAIVLMLWGIRLLFLIYVHMLMVYSLFFLDSPLRSYGLIVKATRMVVYNLPVFVPIFAVCIVIIDYVHIPGIVGFLFSFVTLYLWAALVTNIYIKKVHDQFSLYFPKKG